MDYGVGRLAPSPEVASLLSGGSACFVYPESGGLPVDFVTGMTATAFTLPSAPVVPGIGGGLVKPSSGGSLRSRNLLTPALNATMCAIVRPDGGFTAGSAGRGDVVIGFSGHGSAENISGGNCGLVMCSMKGIFKNVPTVPVATFSDGTTVNIGDDYNLFNGVSGIKAPWFVAVTAESGVHITSYARCLSTGEEWEYVKSITKQIRSVEQPIQLFGSAPYYPAASWDTRHSQASAFAMYIDRAMPLAWLKGVARRPDSLFSKIRRNIYSLPSGGSSQDLAATGTAAASGTATPSASIALAGVGVALATGTATATGSATLTATGGATASGTAAPRIDIALSALGLSIATGTAMLDTATAGSLAASGSAAATGTAGHVASVTIAAAGLAQAAATAGLSAQILRAGAGAAQASGNATLAAQLTALAQGAAQASGTASLTATSDGTLIAPGTATAAGAAALVLEVRLQAAGSATATGTATTSSTHAQHASGSASATGTATATTGAAGSLDAPGAGAATGAAQLAAAVTLTAAGFAQAMGAGAVTLQVPLSAFGSAQATGTAVIYQPPALLRLAARARRITTLHTSVRHA